MGSLRQHEAFSACVEQGGSVLLRLLFEWTLLNTPVVHMLLQLVIKALHVATAPGLLSTVGIAEDLGFSQQALVGQVEDFDLHVSVFL